MTGFGAIFARGTIAANPEGSGLVALQEQELPLGDIGDIDDFISGFQFSLGELRDAQYANAAKVGGPLKGGGTLGNILDDVSENIGLDAPDSVKVEERFMQQYREMYDHALSSLNKELLCREKELEKLSLRLRESKAHSARKEKESGLGENMQMRLPPGGEVEASELGKGKKIKGKATVALPMVLSGKLRDAQEAVIVKAGIPFQWGGSIANIFDGVSDSVSLDVPGAVKAAEKFMRQCKDMYDHAFLRLCEELSYHENECKKLTSMLRDSEARSTQGGKELGELRAALETVLREKADLTVQIRQLNTKIFGLRKQSEVATEKLETSQDLLKNAREEVAALAAAKSEVERNVATYLEDTATPPGDGLCKDVSCGYVIGNVKKRDFPPVSFFNLFFLCSFAFADWLLTFDAFDRLKSELLRSKDTLREALDREKSFKLLCAEKESELVSLWCELEDKAKELGQLWGKVGQAKCEFNELHVHVSAHFAAKESALAMVSTLEAQIQIVRTNDSARANMIARLSSKLSKAKTEVVNVRAEVMISNTRAGQKVAAYSKSVIVAKAELKRALDRASSSKEYVRCRSRREVLEDIHARGFDLSVEIEQAKGEEYDDKFLLSDAEDGEERAARP
ncbi:uncharacterized protein [Nicotiana sylvestris]|uniref:uncharacterized protein n=1 Tax=Nicotiana sylvestris TaxID=4096 RepID=UPI00388CDC02